MSTSGHTILGLTCAALSTAISTLVVVQRYVGPCLLRQCRRSGTPQLSPAGFPTYVEGHVGPFVVINLLHSIAFFVHDCKLQAFLLHASLLAAPAVVCRLVLAATWRLRSEGLHSLEPQQPPDGHSLNGAWTPNNNSFLFLGRREVLSLLAVLLACVVVGAVGATVQRVDRTDDNWYATT